MSTCPDVDSCFKIKKKVTKKSHLITVTGPRVDHTKKVNRALVRGVEIGFMLVRQETKDALAGIGRSPNGEEYGAMGRVTITF